MANTSAKPASVVTYPLEQRKIFKKFTIAMIWRSIFFLAILVTLALTTQSSGNTKGILIIALIAVYVIAAILEFLYQREYYRTYYYDIEKDFLIIKKGFITPHQTMLPYEKLQDVYMDQDIFDRIFNLWDVHVSTATAMSGHEAHIDGVSLDNGEKLREIILEKIRKKGG
jgi:membrane protein YdbS with pleckstrin-like domain